MPRKYQPKARPVTGRRREALRGYPQRKPACLAAALQHFETKRALAAWLGVSTETLRHWVLGSVRVNPAAIERMERFVATQKRESRVGLLPVAPRKEARL